MLRTFSVRSGLFKGKFTTAQVKGGRGAAGADVERRRREDRGAEWGGAWVGCVPLPTGGGDWGGAAPPSQKIF